MPRIAVNDWVIYHKLEASAHPGPEAHDVRPGETGDLYSYVIDQFWRVSRVNPDGTFEAVSNTGATGRFRASDPGLERPGIWRRLLHRRRFPR